MPYIIFNKLGLWELKASRMTIQLVNRFVRYSKGIIDKILVKVEKFIFPNKFVVLELDNDMEIALILG